MNQSLNNVTLGNDSDEEDLAYNPNKSAPSNVADLNSSLNVGKAQSNHTRVTTPKCSVVQSSMKASSSINQITADSEFDCPTGERSLDFDSEKASDSEIEDSDVDELKSLKRRRENLDESLNRARSILKWNKYLKKFVESK